MYRMNVRHARAQHHPGALSLAHSLRVSQPRAGIARALALLLIGALGVCSATPQDDAQYRFAAASRDGIGKFYFNREIAQVMGFDGAPWLDRESREREERPEWLLDELALSPHMVVADVGAGSGYLARRLAARIPQGQVLALDVQPEMVQMLERLAREPGMQNILAQRSGLDDIGLRASSIDLALLVDVYHELAFPREIMRSIVNALRPDGRVVFVEYRGEDPSVPIKALHKMRADQVRLEMQGLPLVWERDSERLPWQHIIVFRKKETPVRGRGSSIN